MTPAHLSIRHHHLVARYMCRCGVLDIARPASVSRGQTARRSSVRAARGASRSMIEHVIVVIAVVWIVLGVAGMLILLRGAFAPSDEQTTHHESVEDQHEPRGEYPEL